MKNSEIINQIINLCQIGDYEIITRNNQVYLQTTIFESDCEYYFEEYDIEQENETIFINLEKAGFRLERLPKEYFNESETFWKKEADQTLARAIKELEIIENTPRWKQSQNGIPSDILELLFISNTITSTEYLNGIEYADKKSQEAIEAYKKNPPKLTEEDKNEMRAAFGEGAIIIDIITGKRIQL